MQIANMQIHSKKRESHQASLFQVCDRTAVGVPNVDSLKLTPNTLHMRIAWPAIVSVGKQILCGWYT